MRLVFFDVGPGPTMMNTEVFNCENMSDDEIETLGYNMAVEQAERYGDFFGEDDEIPEDYDDQYFTEHAKIERVFKKEDSSTYWVKLKDISNTTVA